MVSTEDEHAAKNAAENDLSSFGTTHFSKHLDMLVTRLAHDGVRNVSICYLFLCLPLLLSTLFLL